MARTPVAWLMFAITGSAVVAGVTWSVWSANSRNAVWADPNDPRLVALGRAVYVEHCASCHGANLEGQANWRTRRPDGRLPAPPHDATGHTWHHPDEQLFEITKHGVQRFAPDGYESDMPVFAELLADKEVWAVLAFIKSRWTERERAFQERVNRMAEEAKR